MAYKRQYKPRAKRSGYEQKIADNLTSRGVEFRYEDTKLHYLRKIRSGTCLECGHTKVYQHCTYTPDFDVYKEGVLVYHIESKGRFLGKDRTKMKEIKEQHPDLDIRFLVYRKNQEVEAWLTKRGYPYAVGHAIPDEWLP